MTKQSKAYLALIYICIVWGTTYLAIRVAMQYYPAFLFAGVRQVIAGVILFSIGLATNKGRDYSAKNILRQMLVGFLLLTMGNGLVTWGEKYVPSGVAALICSVMPIFAVLFNLFGFKKEHFNALIGGGLLLGAVGVGLIFKDNIAELGNRTYLMGIIATLIATCSWAFGSVRSKKFPAPVNPMFNSGLQLFFGGAFMLMISPFVDSYTDLAWHTEGILYLVYLIIFGSVIAYGAYIFALRELPVGITTLYAYINPLVAVIMGYFILQEPLTIYTAFAFIAIVGGVYVVNLGYRREHKKAEIRDFENGPVTAVPAAQDSSKF
jgi:drug/metabolite transporter (DMT)-like permease